VTVGLVCASASLIAVTADTRVTLAAITLVVAAVTMWRKTHPLWLLGAGALLGAIGLG
jgi:chromate transporter